MWHQAVTMARKRHARICLAKPAILTIFLALLAVAKTKLVKFKIHHTDEKFFNKEASHMGFG